jgi:imidazolonepropionase-like amidohydrolase
LKPGTARWLKRIATAFAIGAVVLTVGLLAARNLDIYRVATPPDSALMIRAARLIDGTGGPPLMPGMVLVDGNRIVAVGPDLEVPPGARILELGAATMLPGLIDVHVHLGGPMVDDPDDFGVGAFLGSYWDQFRHLRVRRRTALEYGVTTVKSLGETYLPWTLELRRKLLEGELEGPRLLIVGPIFTAPGGHPVGNLGGNPWLIENGTRQVDDPAQARIEVARLDSAGVDAIKVVYSAGRFGGVPKMSYEVLEAIVAEAHEHGLRVVAHVATPDEIREAVEAGVDGVEHGTQFELDPAILERMVADGVFYVPTLTVEQREEWLPLLQANLRRAAEAGVSIALGTDSPNPEVRFGEGVHRELELMVAAGLTPMQALVAATGEAARHLGREDELGTIQAGKAADLIAVSGDPLQDISATRGIVLVVREGRVVVQR